MNLVDLKEKIEELDINEKVQDAYGNDIGTATMEAKYFKEKVLAILDDAIKRDENESTTYFYPSDFYLLKEILFDIKKYKYYKSCNTFVSKEPIDDILDKTEEAIEKRIGSVV